MPKHKYRGYSSILWGANYESKSHAHYCFADSSKRAVEYLKNGIGIQNLQVQTCQGWEWVGRVPVHLGGINRHWHGERI